MMENTRYLLIVILLQDLNSFIATMATPNLQQLELKLATVSCIEVDASPAKPSTELRTTTRVMDPRGDLFVVASGRDGLGSSSDPVRFQVCSRTLARCSRVFEAMLFGSFAESKDPQAPGPDGLAEWCLDLPEAHPEAMKTLFEIMHC